MRSASRTCASATACRTLFRRRRRVQQGRSRRYSRSASASLPRRARHPPSPARHRANACMRALGVRQVDMAGVVAARGGDERRGFGELARVSKPRACCSRSASASSRPSIASVRSGCSKYLRVQRQRGVGRAIESAGRARAALRSIASMPRREASRLRKASAAGSTAARGIEFAREVEQAVRVRDSIARGRLARLPPPRARPGPGLRALRCDPDPSRSPRCTARAPPLPSAAVRRPASSASCACSSKVSTWSCGHSRSSAATRSNGSASSSHSASAAARCAQIRQSASADAMREEYAPGAWPA